MSEIAEHIKYACEFCKAEFSRETTIASHMCKTKHRWFERDLPSSRIAFQSWMQFYSIHAPTSKKYKTYEEFMKSAYYSAFQKFGSYCVDVKVVNPSKYVEWLLKNNTKIDNWNSDKSYTIFLTEYIRREDPYDAIKRSIEHCFTLTDSEGIQMHDCLRYGNPNKICHSISSGKISPWLLYQSESGVKFLDTLTGDHIRIIIDYIEPDKWATIFKQDEQTTKDIASTLAAAGF